MVKTLPKPKKMPTPDLIVEWELAPLARTARPPRKRPRRSTPRPTKLLKQVIERHPKTPWADLAQDELNRGFGVQRDEWHHNPKYDERRSSCRSIERRGGAGGSPAVVPGPSKTLAWQPPSGIPAGARGRSDMDKLTFDPPSSSGDARSRRPRPILPAPVEPGPPPRRPNRPPGRRPKNREPRMPRPNRRRSGARAHPVRRRRRGPSRWSSTSPCSRPRIGHLLPEVQQARRQHQLGAWSRPRGRPRR